MRTGWLWTGCKRTTKHGLHVRSTGTLSAYRHRTCKPCFSFSVSCSFTTGPQATCPDIGTEHANPVQFFSLSVFQFVFQFVSCSFTTGPQVTCPHIGSEHANLVFSCSFTTGPQATCPHIGTKHANTVQFFSFSVFRHSKMEAFIRRK